MEPKGSQELPEGFPKHNQKLFKSYRYKRLQWKFKTPKGPNGSRRGPRVRIQRDFKKSQGSKKVPGNPPGVFAKFRRAPRIPKGPEGARGSRRNPKRLKTPLEQFQTAKTRVLGLKQGSLKSVQSWNPPSSGPKAYRGLPMNLQAP